MTGTDRTTADGDGVPAPGEDRDGRRKSSTPDRAGRVGRGKRGLALVSLACAAVLVADVVVFVVGNLGLLVIALVGLVLTVAGAWWAVTERMPRRLAGIAGAVIGLATVVAALLRTTPHVERPAARIVAVAVLAAVMVGTGRAALALDLRQRDRLRPTSVPPPRHPVLLCNPWSGGGKVERFGLVEAARALGVEVVLLDHGLDLEQLARRAVADGADCLGMAGGDGSQALVASVAVEHDLPFVCVSAGTRNHFALDLGLERDDPRANLAAFRDGVERRIDYATVGDRFFVNNVSLGVYATIVAQEGYREAKAETARSLLPEIMGRTDEPFDLQFTGPDGTEVDGAFLVQVSNNPYVLGATLDATQRRRLDSGSLGIVAVTATTGTEAAAIVALSALGQRRQSPHWHEFTTGTFEVRSRSGTALAGVDGEALELATPLEFRIHPRGLRLLVPRGNLTVAERRRARSVSFGDLVAIARGRDPLWERERERESETEPESETVPPPPVGLRRRGVGAGLSVVAHVLGPPGPVPVAVLVATAGVGVPGRGRGTRRGTGRSSGRSGERYAVARVVAGPRRWAGGRGAGRRSVSVPVSAGMAGRRSVPVPVSVPVPGPVPGPVPVPVPGPVPVQGARIAP